MCGTHAVWKSDATPKLMNKPAEAELDGLVVSKIWRSKILCLKWVTALDEAESGLPTLRIFL